MKEKIKQYIELFVKNADDKLDRIQYIGVLKDYMKEESEKDSGSPENQIAIMIYEAIRKNRAQNWNELQIAAMVYCISIYLRNPIDEDINKVDEILFHCDLDWIMGDN